MTLGHLINAFPFQSLCITGKALTYNFKRGVDDRAVWPYFFFFFFQNLRKDCGLFSIPYLRPAINILNTAQSL